MKALIAILLMLTFFSNTASYATDKEHHSSTKTTKKTAQAGQPEKAMISVEKRGKRDYVVGSLNLNAPAERIWNILVDYHNAPQVFQNLKSCEVVGHEGDAKLIRQIVKTGSPIKFDYTVALTEEKPTLITWHRQSGSLEEVTGSWQLDPLDSGEKTKVTYSIFIDGGFFLPPWLLTNQLKGYLPIVLKSLKDRAEAMNVP